MPTAYDTFNYSTELQRPSQLLADIGRQRLAQQAAQGDRLANLELFKLQQQATANRDQRLQDNELAQINEREKARREALRQATRDEQETAYKMAYPETTDAEMKKLSTADLLSGIERRQNEKNREASLGIDSKIKDETAAIDSILTAQKASDQKEIRQRLAADPVFLQAIKNNVHTGRFGIGNKGATFANDFAKGTATLDQLRAEADDRVKFETELTAAVARASVGMTDKNGQPIIPPESLNRVQQHIAQIDALSTLRQSYISKITDPKMQIEALGDTGSKAMLNQFQDNEIGGRLPGQPPPATAPAPTTPPPSAGVTTPPSASNSIFNRVPPSGLPPDIYSGVTTYDPNNPGMVRRGYDALSRGYDAMTGGAANSMLRMAGVQEPGTAPLPVPGQPTAMDSLRAIGLQNGQTAIATAPQQPGSSIFNRNVAGGAGAPGNPFASQQASQLMTSVLGTADTRITGAAADLARKEGVDESSLKKMFADAAQGDTVSIQRLRSYVQRVQSGQMMAPPSAMPNATYPQ